jgi:hypothetical protein
LGCPPEQPPQQKSKERLAPYFGARWNEFASWF